MNAMSGKVVADHQQDWCQHLPFITSAYDSSRHKGTNYFPNSLVYRREIRMPLDVICGPIDAQVSHNEYAEFDSTSIRHTIQYTLPNPFRNSIICECECEKGPDRRL